ncbi:LytR/AlgR family response regulator transcription factor [Methylobacillus flagellatus]|uniref:Transcriptional regulator, LytR/AlgR family n=1 Tax=Methylobacillus flagellatus (strain ATCC 51484 / DSM 6875 / VKM B-1610 / KT) TaxID=265072 RepID=Q1GXB1_METFK|nr:LytTR family DNA-binding domain-containing protein [Methylobacillus flagellatus]ABE48307.1 transcriptional regulator, LytR/AlgR family [Methylobacillus flagellatus KT]
MSGSLLNVVIADDEPPARNRLRDLLADIPGVALVGEARHGNEALDLAQQLQPHVLLLDIRMPSMDGIEAASHAQKLAQPPAIIFTTAFDGYAIQAFEMNAVDYLLKPIRQERLASALHKARVLLPAQLEALRPLQRARTHFSVSDHGRILLIPVHEVIYLRAELKYVTLRTRLQEYLIEESLTSLEQELGHLFLRLHRNCLVAQASIRGYEKRNNNGESRWHAILKDVPETVAVSRRQYHLLRKLVSH